MPNKINHAEFVKGVIGFPFGRVNDMNAGARGYYIAFVWGDCTINLPDTVQRHGTSRTTLPQSGASFLCAGRITRVTACPGKGVAGSTETELPIRAGRDEGLPSLTHCRGHCSGVAPFIIID
jgi:hypothetical protein